MADCLIQHDTFGRDQASLNTGPGFVPVSMQLAETPIGF